MKQVSLFGDEPQERAFAMRIPCPVCGSREGRAFAKGPHCQVNCRSCDRYVYFATKSEVQQQEKP